MASRTQSTPFQPLGISIQRRIPIWEGNRPRRKATCSHDTTRIGKPVLTRGLPYHHLHSSSLTGCPFPAILVVFLGNMEQISPSGSAEGSGIPMSASLSSTPLNTGRSSAPQAPQATYSLNAAGEIPGTRPARLILRPFEYNPTGQPGMASAELPQPEYMRFYNAHEYVPLEKQAMLHTRQEDVSMKKKALFPPKPASAQPTLQEMTPRAAWPEDRGPMPPRSYDLPAALLENKLPKEQAFLRTWNAVDHAGTVATCRLERVPLPMLERIPGGPARLRQEGPLVRVRLPQMPAVEGDILRFCQRIMMAFSGAADDCRRLFMPCTELRLPKLDCCKPQAPMQQECKECGYKGHFCPECGTGQNGTGAVIHGAAYRRIPSTRGILGTLALRRVRLTPAQ